MLVCGVDALRIDRHRARELALRQGEVERIERDLAVVQRQMEAHFIHGHFGGGYRGGIELHIGVHAAHALHLQVRVGKQQGRRRRWGGGTRHRERVRFSRRRGFGSQRRRQVGEVQLF